MRIHNASRLRRHLLAAAFALPLTFISAHAETAADAAPSLALRLALEGDPAAASVEFRRTAIAAELANERAGWLWAAGWEALRAGRPDIAERLFDDTEDHAPEAGDLLLLARAEAARARSATAEARFYLDRALEADLPAEAQSAAAARLAILHLRAGEFNEAAASLQRSPWSEERAAEALQAYREGPRRSPRVGGWLGLVPGLGYAYSGETANAIRSFLINGLFIYAMAAQAERDNWAAFSALAFFEITWYTGSIYGGVDAAHRFNQRRMENAVRAIEGGRRVEPDYEALPAIRLQIRF